MFLRITVTAMAAMAFGPTANVGSMAVAGPVAKTAIVRLGTHCTSSAPASGGEVWNCYFDQPVTLYFVSTGGKGHRFRYNLVCGAHRMTNLRPDSAGGDSFKMIPVNGIYRLPWDNSQVVNALHRASRAKPCKLSAYFERYPPADGYDHKTKFVTAVLRLWTG